MTSNATPTPVSPSCSSSPTSNPAGPTSTACSASWGCLDQLEMDSGRTSGVSMAKAPYVMPVSVEVSKRAEHERKILRLLGWGEREIAAGKGYDLDVVLAEADRLLVES
jgi:hypothetical protein